MWRPLLATLGWLITAITFLKFNYLIRVKQVIFYVENYFNSRKKIVFYLKKYFNLHKKVF